MKLYALGGAFWGFYFIIRAPHREESFGGSLHCLGHILYNINGSRSS